MKKRMNMRAKKAAVETYPLMEILLALFFSSAFVSRHGMVKRPMEMPVRNPPRWPRTSMCYTKRER